MFTSNEETLVKQVRYYLPHISVKTLLRVSALIDRELEDRETRHNNNNSDKGRH